MFQCQSAPSSIYPHNNVETKIGQTSEYKTTKAEILIKKQRKIELQKNINPLEIDLRTKDLKRRIKIPICIDGCNCQIFDIYDLFMQKKIICGKCKKEADKNKKNICIESQYFQFNQSICPKSYSCSFILNKYIFHSYSIKQPYAVLLLKKVENQQFLDKIIKKSGNFDFIPLLQQFEGERMQNSQRIIPIFSIQCLYNANKIKIAVRFKNCKHLECYEYTSILELIDKNNKKPECFRQNSINCYHPFCETKIPTNFGELENVMIFDKTITESISQATNFAITLQFQPINNTFKDPFIKIKSLIQISYIKPSDNILLKHSYTLQRYMANCVNMEYDYNLESKYQFSNYQIEQTFENNGDQIQFPARCIKCDLKLCADLQLFVCEFLRQKTNETKYYYCPVCNHKHLNVEKINQIVYFDKYLAQQSFNQPLKNFKYNGDARLGLLFKQTQSIDLNNIMRQYRIERVIPYKDYRSCLNRQQLKVPLFLLKCKNKSYIDYSELMDFLKKHQYSLNDLQCCQCCQNLRIDDFYFDAGFVKIIQKLQAGLNFWDRNIRALFNKLDNTQTDNFEIPKIFIVIKNEFIQVLQPQQQQQQQQQQFQTFNFLTGGFD